LIQFINWLFAGSAYYTSLERRMAVQSKSNAKGGRKGIACRIRKYWHATSGTTAVMFALSLPAIMGAVGVASDFAIYNMKQGKLQSAADSAALAGAKEFSVSTSSKDSISASAKSFALASYDGTTPITVAATVDATKKTVTVDLNEVWSPFFAHFLGAQVTPVVARATASAAGRGNICVLLLNPGASKTGLVDSGSTITANGCDIYSNSNASDGITVNSSGTITADTTCSVGGVSNGGVISPAATTDCPVVEDPLASRVPPSFAGCDFNKFVLSKGSATLNPGTYCGGITISGTGAATFSPGTYVIKDGEFTLSGKSSITGKHVGFYLVGAASLINFTGNTTVDMTGADTGNMSGLLFFEDRGAPLLREHRINSNNAANLTGTIYLPRGTLLVDPSSKVGATSAYTAIIAQKLKVQFGPQLILNSNYGATDVPVPTGIKASEQVVLLK
jgi:Flp pilus assembly protein TadG